MTPIIDLLTDHGAVFLAGSTLLLGIGTLAMAVLRRPVQQQRLGELTLLATLAWLLLACVPLPRWDIGSRDSLASGASTEAETDGIEEPWIGVGDLQEEPSSGLLADAAVGELAVETSFEEPVNSMAVAARLVDRLRLSGVGNGRPS